MKAEIISIGDELLIGQVVNTNASWMAVELNKNGIKVVRITCISDSGDDIKDAIKNAEKNADIILLTGGLGPTKDDITKHVLADYYDSKMIFHKPTYEQVKTIFALRKFKVTQVNKKQAEIPEKCTPLFNQHGTAPGMWFEKDNKVLVSLPGVPFEMKTLISNEVIPRLQVKFNLKYIFHKTIMTAGLGESALAERIKSLEDNLPNNIKLAYLPQPGIVRLRLSASGNIKSELENEVKSYCRKINAIIPEIIFGYDDISLEEVIGKQLNTMDSTISTAESCTGGYIAHLITSIAGSSDYFKGSIVSYANDVKENQLGVDTNILENTGALSQEVIEQMAIGGQKQLKTDYCLATSGIAGPDGGTDDKPVGTVWIALATPSGVMSKLFHFGEHRGRNIRRSSLAALDMLRRELNNSIKPENQRYLCE
ncbi:MAG: competence/damage-inducible protein A [Bacteroidota bacterium]